MTLPFVKKKVMQETICPGTKSAAAPPEMHCGAPKMTKPPIRVLNFLHLHE